MSNRVLNSVNILYTPNIEDVKKYNKYASPNTFVVSSYYNPGAYVGFDYYYQGISYELYYIDHNRNINQLTYNMVPGNGLFIKDNKFDINIDNNTLTTTYFKNKNVIKVNSNTFKEASYLNRGLLGIENNIYYNDNYDNTTIEECTVILNNNKKMDLSNGLKHDLQNIQQYYNKCINIINSINNLYQICIKDLNVAPQINVGDILYYNSEKNIYTVKKINKSGSENIPAMVCVIASNILPDHEPRFMPLKRKMNQYIYDNNNSMYIKNISNQIPIYNTNDLRQININTNTEGGYKGYIAVKRKSWKNNVANPLDSSENYYALTDKSLNITTSEEISKQNINWFVDATQFDYNNNFAILPNGIYTDIINEKIQETIEDFIVYMIITIDFENDQTRYYICPLILQDNRLVNVSTVYGYKLKKTITNNINEALPNIYESYVKLLSQDILSDLSNIQYTILETLSTDFDNSDETYVITEDPTILKDTEVKIIPVGYHSNSFSFEVQSSVSGTIYISASYGSLNETKIISEANKNYSVKLTNNTRQTIYVSIKAEFIPDETNKYKTSTITYSTNGIAANKSNNSQIFSNDKYIDAQTIIPSSHPLYPGIIGTHNMCNELNNVDINIIDGKKLTGEGAKIFNNAHYWYPYKNDNNPHTHKFTSIDIPGFKPVINNNSSSNSSSADILDAIKNFIENMCGDYYLVYTDDNIFFYKKVGDVADESQNQKEDETYDNVAQIEEENTPQPTVNSLIENDIYQNVIIILNIDKNLCTNRSNCYLKFDFIIDEFNNIYKTIYVKYNNSEGLLNKQLYNFTFDNKNDKKILLNGAIKITAYQFENYKDTNPYIIGKFAITEFSNKSKSMTLYKNLEINNIQFTFDDINLLPISVSGETYRLNNDHISIYSTGNIVNNNENLNSNGNSDASNIYHVYSYVMDCNYINEENDYLTFNKKAFAINIYNNEEIWTKYNVFYCHIEILSKDGKKYLLGNLPFNKLGNQLILNYSTNINTEILTLKDIIKFSITNIYGADSQEKIKLNINLSAQGNIINN